MAQTNAVSVFVQMSAVTAIGVADRPDTYRWNKELVITSVCLILIAIVVYVLLIC